MDMIRMLGMVSLQDSNVSAARCILVYLKCFTGCIGEVTLSIYIK